MTAAAFGSGAPPTIETDTPLCVDATDVGDWGSDSELCRSCAASKISSDLRMRSIFWLDSTRLACASPTTCV